LLHDLGKLALIQVLPNDYVRAYRERDRYGSICEAEVAYLGVSHPLFGAVVAHAWRLPVDTCEVIRLHHRVFRRPFTRSCEEKATLVRTADLIAHYLEAAEGPEGDDVHQEMRLSAGDLGLEASELEPLLRAIAAEYQRRGMT